MVDTKFATLSCSFSKTVGPIHLKFRYNLRIAKLYRMQKVASEYPHLFVEIYVKVCHRHTHRRKNFYCIFGIRNPQNGYFR
ncbi:hypothetical protein O3M35_002054 [Rhynocoris fuscipes]|uniref:Uncharacterized protein n=1 Tax=Rhynocoris fuscipes TaxID=488301 RepID=A0AAW1CVK7_9HEMI